MDAWMDAWMDGWMDGWMYGWISVCMDGWTCAFALLVGIRH
jgi:hypothetical protein